MRAAKFTRYQPKRWHPEFDLIVFASFSGQTNKEIGDKFGYTEVHISNILCSPQAEEVRKKLKVKVEAGIEGTIEQRFKGISEKALQRIENFISNDEIAIKSPFLFVDRAFRAAQIAGISQEKNGNSGAKVDINVQNNTQINQTNVGNEVIDRIALALEQSNEVTRLHAGLDPDKQIALENVRPSERRED